MAFKITLKNNTIFNGDSDKTIFDSALKSNITLNHSCLVARCMSCKARVLKGSFENVNEETVLSEVERAQGYLLTCNSKPASDMKLDIEDLGNIKINIPRTLPCKVDYLEKVSKDVIKLILRLPPRTDFEFIPGQYVNLIKGPIKRSYSIAGTIGNGSKLEFFIKRYEDGKMSSYLFEHAKENDLLRLQGALGTFFYRQSSTDTIVFLATGTGIAPVKAILEGLDEQTLQNKKIFVVWGARKSGDFFWNPTCISENIEYIPTLSKQDGTWDGAYGYVQETILKALKDFSKTQVYACGSNNMIKDSKKLLEKKGLGIGHFYSDAFVNSN